MAISKNTKKKYQNSNAAYKEGSATTNARSNLIAITGKAPTYQNSYAKQLNDLYRQVQNGASFNYDPSNDIAFRRFADEYNALSGLAIAGNQQQAQVLTGGYGSTYAPEVANQGLANMQANVDNAKPYFMEVAQEAYMANNDRIKNAYEAGAKARDYELAQFGKRADAYNDRSKLAQQQYSDERNFDYGKYSDTRDFWAKQYKNEQEQSNFEKELAQKDRQNQREYDLTENQNKRSYNLTENQNKRDFQIKSWDTYNKIASTKCAEYNDKKNNKGMKAYLDGLVKAGKITKYMADNLYNQYKYTAPNTSGGTGGRTHNTSNYPTGNNNNNNNNQQEGVITVVDSMGKTVGTYPSGSAKNYTVKTGMLQQVGMNRSNTGRAEAINRLNVDDDLKIWLASYFKL